MSGTSKMLREERIEFLAQMIREGSDYKWENDVERRIWTGVARDIMSEHLAGKKTVLSEACFRAHVEKSDVLLAESAAKLNEGFFSGLADAIGGGLAKTFGKAFGGTKSRNWWIFGGGGAKEDEKYKKAYQDAIENNQEVFGQLATKTVKEIENEIKSVNPEFPNGGSGEDFEKAIGQIFAAYSAISLGAGTPVEGSDQEPSKPPKISAEDANKAIAGLRKLLQFYDRELKDRYTYNMESRTQRLPTLAEALLLEEEEDDLGKEGGKTSGMKGLESNKAPLIIAALGASGVGFGWLVKQPWFLEMFKNPDTVVDAVKWVSSGGHKLGVTHHLGFLMGKPGANLSTMKVADFMKEMAKRGLVDNAGNPSDKLLSLAKEAGNNEFAAWWAKNLAGPAHAKQTLGKAIPKSGSGAFGAGGDVFSGKIMKPVLQKITVAGAGYTATGKALMAAGPLATAVGAGAIIGAGAVKLLRMYGAKKSRTAWIQTTLDKMKDVKEVPKEDRVVPPEETPPEAGEGLKAVFSNKKTDVVAPKEIIVQGGCRGDAVPIEKAALNDEEALKAEAYALIELQLKVMKGITLAKGLTLEKLKQMNIEIVDNRSKKKSTNPTEPGKGPLGVIAIKDGYVPSLSSVLFESADLRVVGDTEAKKSAEYKDIKKKFRKNPDQFTVPAEFDAKEDTAISKMVGGEESKKEKAFNKTSEPNDDMIKKGLNALRKRAKSGSLIVTFDNKTYAELVDKVGLDAPKIKELLKIYSKNPDAAPKITAYNKIINSVTEKEKKELLRNILMNTGMATKAGKKNEALDGGSDNLIIERWSKLAGLI